MPLGAKMWRSRYRYFASDMPPCWSERVYDGTDCLAPPTDSSPTSETTYEASACGSKKRGRWLLWLSMDRVNLRTTRENFRYGEWSRERNIEMKIKKKEIRSIRSSRLFATHVLSQTQKNVSEPQKSKLFWAAIGIQKFNEFSKLRTKLCMS